MIINKKISSFILLTLGLCSCTSFLPKSGPSSTAVNRIAARSPEIKLINLTPSVVKRTQRSEMKDFFAKSFNSLYKRNWGVQSGDVLEVYIWESYPQLLFGSNSIPGITSAASTTKNTALPQQMVDAHGYITVPYAGKIFVLGKTLSQIEHKITSSLKGKANYPQAIVRLVNNVSSSVTVVGEVKNSRLVPLTPRKERILDAIAEAGGVNAPINKVTVQMTRAGITRSMSLEQIIKNPKQNILLQPADVLSVYYKSLSFTVLGATGKSEEVSFETQGISLAQAFGRIGGLNDNRANPSALFIFRFEDQDLVLNKPKTSLSNNRVKIPVVYQVNLNDPGTFLMAQYFSVKDKDVVYVANAPAVQLDKFLSIIGSSLTPILIANRLYW